MKNFLFFTCIGVYVTLFTCCSTDKVEDEIKPRFIVEEPKGITFIDKRDRNVNIHQYNKFIEIFDENIDLYEIEQERNELDGYVGMERPIRNVVMYNDSIVIDTYITTSNRQKRGHFKIDINENKLLFFNDVFTLNGFKVMYFITHDISTKTDETMQENIVFKGDLIRDEMLYSRNKYNFDVKVMINGRYRYYNTEHRGFFIDYLRDTEEGTKSEAINTFYRRETFRTIN